MTSAHDFSLDTIDGAPLPLSSFAGKTLLVVNVASRCGFTPQYAGLEELYRTYKDRGLVVLGVPCNQFAGQEPGSEEEIKTFCSTTYDVTFPLSRKVDVNGEGAHPLYRWLTEQAAEPEGAGPVKWNFGKFLIDRAGHVVARFKTTTTPTSERVLEALERTLDA